MPRVVHGPLPSVELILYITVWTSAIIYSTCCLFKASKDYENKLHPDDIVEGWSVLGRKKDDTDFEWHFWLATTKLILPALVLHSFIGLLISGVLPQYKAHYCLLFTLSFLLAFLGIRPVIFMVGHCLVIYLCAMTQSATLTWIGSLLVLASLQLSDQLRAWQLSYLSKDEKHKDFIHFICMMSNLRCISFALEYCWQDAGDKRDKPMQRYTFLDMLVFNFYLPLFANGPVVTFESFYRTFYKYPATLSRAQVLSLVRDSVTTMCWYLLLECYMHFAYSSAMARDEWVFQSLDSWAMSGIMYSQLNIFLTKYVIFYRCTGVFARLDNVDPPRAPRCVTTMYLFGDMWRYFDRGLYIWMKRYIYVPLGGSQQGLFMQLVGSFSAFCFVWCWHGGHYPQLWWFLPNWLGIVAEAVGGIVLQIPAVRDIEVQLSPTMSRRIRALFGTITVMALILSNLVFLIGTEPVWFYIQKVFYLGFPVGPATLCIVMYCSVQCNMELNRHKTEW